MQLLYVFIWHNVTARCRRYVSPQMCRSSLEFAVARWLEHPAGVVEGSGFSSHLELKIYFWVLSPHISFYLLFIAQRVTTWLQNVVIPCVYVTYCDCAMRSLCRSTNDLLITGVLSSSVVIASDECLKGRGFNSHLELNCFSWVFLLIHIILFITKIKPRRNWKQWLCKIFFWGGGWGDKQGALWSMGKWWISIALLHYHAIYYIVYLKLVYILLLYIHKT